MRIFICKSKIHRAIVTDVNLNYEGSITIAKDLMDAANIYPYERVQILNINNGERAETYVIEGKSKSGVIALNGALARLAQVGDPLIIISYAVIEEAEAQTYRPKIVIVNEKNEVVQSI